MSRLLYVNVNRSYDPTVVTSPKALRKLAKGGWRVTLSSAWSADYLVAVHQGRVLAAWDVLGSKPSDAPWSSTNPKKRTDVVLGRPVIVPTAWTIDIPHLRSGAAFRTV